MTNETAAESEKKAASKFLVALATYNERENLPHLAAEILRIVPEADLLVIDDSSPDGTGLWAERFAESQPRFKVLIRSGKLGLGSAVRDIFRYALENHYEFLVNLDADGSHPPEKIPTLLELAERTGADVVIGSRYVAGGKTVGWPLRRRLMSRAVNLYARILLGLPTKDNSGAFRCYRTGALEKRLEENILSIGYSFFEEILFLIRRDGGSLVETPITFTDRTRGRSKINRHEIVRSLAIILRLGLSRPFKKTEPARRPDERPKAE